MNAPQAPSPTRSALLSGNGAALVLVVAWGMNFPLIEQLLGHWDMLSTTLSRQIIGATLLVTLLWMRTRRFPIHRALPWRRMTILGFMGPFCASLLTTLAVFSAGSVAVAIVYAMAPLIAAVVARVFFAISPARGIIIGIALAVTGGLIVKVHEFSNASVTGGEGFMFLALVGWTWHSIAAQKWLKGFSQTEIAAYTILPGSILLAVAVSVAWASGLATLHAPLTETTITLAVAIGVVPIALGNLMWHVGVNRLGVTPMALWGNLVPVAAIGLAAWFGAVPQPAQIAGGLVILAGVVYAQIASLRQPRIRCPGLAHAIRRVHPCSLSETDPSPKVATSALKGSTTLAHRFRTLQPCGNPRPDAGVANTRDRSTARPFVTCLTSIVRGVRLPSTRR